MENCETNSNSTFCPEFEYAATQNNSKSANSKKQNKYLKFSQDISQLQLETLNCLKSYQKRKNPFSVQELQNKKDEILYLIKYEKSLLSNKSLKVFQGKLLQIDRILEEEQRQNEIHSSKLKRINKTNKVHNKNENSKEDDETSLLLLEKSQSEIVIPDTNQIVTELTEKQTNEQQPLNLCVRNLCNLQVNDEILDLDLNGNDVDLSNPIDLSLKINHNINNNIIITKNIEIIPSNSQNLKKFILNNFPLGESKKIENSNVNNFSKSSQNQQQITEINQNNKTIPNNFENNQRSTKKLCDLTEAELEAIKQEFKAKIIQIINERLNEENPVLHKPCSDKLQCTNNTTNKETVEKLHDYRKENIEIVKTKNDFENLWSQSIIQSPSKTQPIEYSDLQEAVDHQNVYKSDGTDTNHIDIDLSIHSLSPLPTNDIKSYNLNSISYYNYSPKVIEHDGDNAVYTLSEKHILRLATALNLNIDYLKLQIRLCTMDYTRNNYDFDDISVIAPSQSPINISQMRNLNQISRKMYKNPNISKKNSHFDISSKSNYDIYKRFKRMMKKQNKYRANGTADLFSNFAKR